MKKILFVCTGNTCRSPMAEAIFNAAAPGGFCAFSAGIAAPCGKPVSENSVSALKEIGIQTNHKSVPVTKELLEDYDYIVGMTGNHANKLIADYPDFTEKIFAFPFDVGDPYGCDLAVYRKCREQIQHGIDMIINEFCNEKQS